MLWPKRPSALSLAGPRRSEAKGSEAPRRPAEPPARACGRALRPPCLTQSPFGQSRQPFGPQWLRRVPYPVQCSTFACAERALTT
jgi:hypothetical protein